MAKAYSTPKIILLALGEEDVIRTSEGEEATQPEKPTPTPPEGGGVNPDTPDTPILPWAPD